MFEIASQNLSSPSFPSFLGEIKSMKICDHRGGKSPQLSEIFPEEISRQRGLNNHNYNQYLFTFTLWQAFLYH